MTYHILFPSITITSSVLQLFYNYSSSQDIICIIHCTSGQQDFTIRLTLRPHYAIKIPQVNSTNKLFILYSFLRNFDTTTMQLVPPIRLINYYTAKRTAKTSQKRTEETSLKKNNKFLKKHHKKKKNNKFLNFETHNETTTQLE